MIPNRYQERRGYTGGNVDRWGWLRATPRWAEKPVGVIDWDWGGGSKKDREVNRYARAGICRSLTTGT